MNATLVAAARRTGAALVVCALTSTVVSAQLPNVSTAAFGMGGNYTAVARGYNALAWNPAMLGMSGNPGFSLGLMSAGGTSGLDPIDLSAFKPYDGQVIPDAVKRAWLQKVTARGGETGNLNGGATPIALSIGHFAFQLSTAAYASGKMTPDAFEAVMFGNAGFDSVARPLDFSGSDVRMSVFTTGAVGYGMPIGDHLAVGVTGKYIVGNFMLDGRDNGSALTMNNVQVNFPMVYTQADSNASTTLNNGRGYGVDVGAAWRSGRLTIGGALQNVVNTFEWDTVGFKSKAGTASFDGTTNTTNFDDQPYGAAPQSLRQAVADDRFHPTLAVGAAFRVNRRLLVSGDMRQNVSDKGIKLGERTQVGVGAELRLIPFVPLRAGVTQFSDGTAISGGAGVSFLGVEVGVAGSLRTHTNGGGRDAGLMLGVLSIH